MIVRHLPIERATPEDGSQYWVGYYDKQPWSASGEQIIVHRTARRSGFPDAGETCEVGTVAGGTFDRVATTRAWNWQQGAHLRWHRIDGSEALLFNDLDAQGRAVSRWVTADGREIHRIDSPLYTVTRDGSTGLTLSFGRLSRLRPEYGYPAVSDPHPEESAPREDGIWRVDPGSGTRTLLCSIADLATAGAQPVDLQATGSPHQHVNHIMCNPSGTRCCFLHRYERSDGILRSRLFTIGINGSGLRLLMEGMISHYDWLDDGRIVAWGGRRRILGAGSESPGLRPRVMNLMRRTLKPLYYALGKPRVLMNKVVGDSYLVIPDAAPCDPAVFARNELVCDGHNTFLRRSDGPARWMLTDGYPDLKSRQPLYLWDLKESGGYEIGRFQTPRELDGVDRVDLHPRFSRDGSAVCIDSALSGDRAVYTLDVRAFTGGAQA